MKRTCFQLAAAGMLVVLAACAPAAGTNGGEPGPRSDRNFISTEEVRASTAQNAYDAVQSMRASWLRKKRGEQSFYAQNDVIVYLNNARMGGLDSLRQISLGTVTWMRFFEPSAANYRWGTGHSHGAILVSTEPTL